LRYIEKPLAFYKQGGYRKLLSWILILQGRAHRDKGDYEAALSSFNELHQLGEQLGDQAQMGLADLDIGNVLSREEQYTEALRHFDDGHKIFESLKVDVYMAYAAQNRASVLWQLGRSEEAKAALDEATSIAGQSYKSLLADVHLTRSLLELSDWQIQNAKIDSQKALDLAGTQSPDIAVQVYSALALAQARSGATRAGTLAGDKAVEIANGTNDPQLLSGALLASAEATLADRDAKRALEIALSVQQTFARFGKQDSEWRAWLIAALASSRLGNDTAAHEYSSNAVSQLSSLEQKWGAEACSGYLARSDIMRFRRQLDQLLKP
jgi:tetratricopeptide (TPR) repeat protein